MAIQDLINEVNSIQTKKQAIKEAITAKGVTSKGKLSKFADEIKQISTGEPDWYMINRMRLEDGKERVLVRSNVRDFTNIDIKQLTEMGGGVYNESNSLRARVEQDLHIVNGTFFKNKESLAVYNETHEDVNISSDAHNDNYKFTYSFDGKPKKEIIFNDVNSYNYLKPFHNKPLLDRTAVYLKGTLYKIGIAVNFNNTKDLINTSAKPRQFQTADLSDKPIEVMPIDSTMFIFASQAQANMAAGFVKLSLNDNDKTVSKIALDPIDQCFHSTKVTTDTAGTSLYMTTDRYTSLPMGHYMYIITLNQNTYAVFVGINYVVNADGLKEKNIEVYPYRVSIVNNYNIINGQVAPNKTNIPYDMIMRYNSAEWYINLGATNTIYSTEVKVLRRKVLADNGTPEANASKFLNGQDALILYDGRKNIRGRSLVVQNLFKNNSDQNIDYMESSGTKFRVDCGVFESMVHAQMVSNIYNQDSKTTGFIRIGEDMSYVELQKVTSPVKNADIRFMGNPPINDFIFLPDGIGLSNTENKAMFIPKINGNLTGNAYTIKKSDNTEITTTLYPTDKTISIFLYITTNTEIQDYIKSKSLADIWTEIQDVLAHKEDYEAYNEQ